MIFQRTPYETAPAVVQRDTLKRAQVRLYRAGWYRGGIDGDPGPDTVRAIRMYQRDANLLATGRLDMETLSEMDLLPRNRQFFPAPTPGREPDDFDELPGAHRRVYRGIWIR
jgi:peptidoglycan hydrolase-like protein with peptidoglycan-binding domain